MDLIGINQFYISFRFKLALIILYMMGNKVSNSYSVLFCSNVLWFISFHMWIFIFIFVERWFMSCYLLPLYEFVKSNNMVCVFSGFLHHFLWWSFFYFWWNSLITFPYIPIQELKWGKIYSFQSFTRNSELFSLF